MNFKYWFSIPACFISSATLIRFFILCALTLIISCTQGNVVKEYFQFHGMDYPADVSGVALLSIDYVGIERDELLAPGAREFIEEGIIFIKGYFQKESVQTILPGVKAVVVSKPVLFRGDSGGVGLMVKVTGFGTGKPGNEVMTPVEWIGDDRRFWKAENFAYFNRNEFYKWQYGGWVYLK
ncbi:MAG TPA: hypothetical protein ENG83_15095 [Nitrospirae bacterium]|nr:hypothetical protein BMS3Abin06_00942 [bacterium BMS3Abin06]HDH13495.1 hypothetical protein [Nitrospirota bacterium]HDZ01065.1 hypothetical protein [Nitrospirota bacterium]